MAIETREVWRTNGPRLSIGEDAGVDGRVECVPQGDRVEVSETGRSLLDELTGRPQ